MAAPLEAPERPRQDPLAPDPEATLRRLALALERRGVLDALVALVEDGDHGAGRLLGRADRPEVHERLAAWSRVLRALAELDPTPLARALAALGGAPTGSARPGVGRAQPLRPGRALLRRLTQPELWRGLGVALDLLAALGGAGRLPGAED
jgi:uncharacterized protein YjgD (DUF1641 family)